MMPLNPFTNRETLPPPEEPELVSMAPRTNPFYTLGDTLSGWAASATKGAARMGAFGPVGTGIAVANTPEEARPVGPAVQNVMAQQARPDVALEDFGATGQRSGGMPSMGGGGGPVQMREVDLLTPSARAKLGRWEQGAAQHAQDYEQRAVEHAQVKEAAAFEQERALQADEKGRQAAEVTRQQEEKAALAEFDAATKEAAAFQFEPDGGWKKDDAAVATGIIGVALAGIGNMFGPIGSKGNVALDMINQDIERRLRAQDRAYNAKKDTAAAAQSAYGMARQRFGDQRAAEAVTRAGLREAYATQMQRMAASGESIEKRAQADAMADQLRRQSFEDAKNFTTMKAFGGGGGAPKPAVDGLIDVEPGLIFDDGKGNQRVARSNTEAQKIRDRQGFEAKIDGILGQISDLDKKADFADKAFPLSAYNRQRAVLVEAAIPVVSQATEQGVVRDTERGPIMNSLGVGAMGRVQRSGEHIFGVDRTKDIDTARQTLGQGSRGLIDQQGGPTVQEVIVPKTDARGVTTYQRKTVLVSPGAERVGGAPRRPPMPGTLNPFGKR
jgi:hypothetical protein